MPVFNYIAKTIDGKQINGVVEAASDQAAASLIKTKGYFVVSITKKDVNSLENRLNTIRGVSSKERVNFTRQLATMVAAGLPLPNSLQVLSEQTTNVQMKQVITECLRDVEGGSPLSVSIGKFPKIFSPTYKALLRAGEASGKMQEILLKLADTMEEQQEFKAKFVGALIYPAIVMIAMVGVMAVMMLFVVPKLSNMYNSLGAELPLPTKILIGISGFMINYWWLMLIGIFGAMSAFNYFKKTEIGSIYLSKISYALPVFGSIYKEKDLTEFTSTFSLLISSGIPIVDALQIVADAVDNVLMRSAIEQGAKNVTKGFSLSKFLRAEPIFPPVVGQMVAVGEETGSLDAIMERLSKYFKNNAETSIKALSTAMEPIILIMLGVMVLFLILSIITPIYKLTSSL